MNSPSTTSFPFLAIAKAYGVPYRDVICGAHVLDPNSFFRFPTVHSVLLPKAVEDEIIYALIRERDRRAGLPLKTGDA